MFQIVTLTFALSLAAPIVVAGATFQEPKSEWSYVEKQLSRAGFSKAKIKEFKAMYEPKDFLKVVELNTLLYLKQADIHGIQVTPDSVKNVRSFMETHRPVLSQAEKNYGVFPATIASLLWIESRHGKNKGTFHVVSVYLSLLQADRPAVVRFLKAEATDYRKNIDKKIQAEIAKRAKKKAQWALAELKALKHMHTRDKKLVANLRGSFSGAFGMAQFIPSSYQRWARGHDKKKAPDLTRSDDAILSVANYLHSNGWKRKIPKTHLKALMHYNNSEDYAKAILKLADQVSPPVRKPSSKRVIKTTF